jgi:hypothetical protein
MNANSTPNITFVCCVDSGWLEAQTVLMVESLRRWGGRFAQAPIVAVTPRFGFPISTKTRRLFEKFDVEYIHFQADHAYSWLPYVNKPEALLAVEKSVSSEYIGWLDSDLLIVDEPDQLFLGETEDFVGCAADKNVGTSGPGDQFESYWNSICAAIGIDVNQLPWVTTEAEHQQIRLLWNSGIFVYRRETGFGKHYLDTCLQLIDSRFVPNVDGYFSIGMNEQIGLGLAMFKAGLRWRPLPFSHNFTISTRSDHAHWDNKELLMNAKVLHYHDSMLPQHWDNFLSSLQKAHPDVVDWLTHLGPMTSFAPIQWRVMSKFLEEYRSQKEATYRKTCTAV